MSRFVRQTLIAHFLESGEYFLLKKRLFHGHLEWLPIAISDWDCIVPQPTNIIGDMENTRDNSLLFIVLLPYLNSDWPTGQSVMCYKL